MATINIGINSTPVTAAKTYTLSDADVTRMVSALKVYFNIPTATNAQAMATWADFVTTGLKRITKDTETKVNAPSDIDIT